MFNFVKKNKKNIQEEWNTKGEKYASEINSMVEFGEKNGWENWKGKEPEDEREHLASEILSLLKKANTDGKTEEFRDNFPPSHSPIIDFIEKNSQSVEQLYFIENQKIVFLIGTSYQERQAYLLNGTEILELDSEITAIGKSKIGNVFAIANKNKISTFQNWEGSLISEFKLDEAKDYEITELIPFNNGLKLILVSSEGIYLISENAEKLIHPVNEENEEDWTSYIDMENATLSNNNQL